MKTLELPAYPGKLKSSSDQNVKTNEPVAVKPAKVKSTALAISKHRTIWLNPESRENVSVKEAVVRGALVVTGPMLSAIDWYNGTHTLYFIVPVLFYLEVSAFTLYCPIKALFSSYRQPIKYE